MINPATSLPVAAHTQTPKVGVLLANLGTPAAPTTKAIRAYLKEFLSDDRVVDLRPAFWWLILNGIILRVRPRKLAARYAAIWTDEGGPLLRIGRAQAQRLSESLSQQFGQPVPVALAMRYGRPSVGDALMDLEAQGVRKLVVLPLFPQYSATTTAAVFDALYDALKQRRWPPEIRTVNGYHDHPAYITALAASVEADWQSHGRGEHLLMSFHGIPQRYFDLGDPYYCACQKTARLLAAALGLEADQWSVSFQSRFGREPWLKPYTDEHLKALAAQGVRKLDVIAPGFAADCLETYEEIADEYAELFESCAPGACLRYISALNESAAHIAALSAIAAPLLR